MDEDAAVDLLLRKVEAALERRDTGCAARLLRQVWVLLDLDDEDEDGDGEMADAAPILAEA